METGNYAIISSGGKQYKVQSGDVIFVEKFDCKENEDNIKFDVVACQNENELLIGNPYVSSAKVFGTVLKCGRSKKITVFTYKPKKHVKRKMGHRQDYVKVEINQIVPDVSVYD
ncbi:50S ribosomal protein L21 [Clostridia bacterium]|nr:50S ribosomal protein L21 [Clostridia bacterium]